MARDRWWLREHGPDRRRSNRKLRRRVHRVLVGAKPDEFDKAPLPRERYVRRCD